MAKRREELIREFQDGVSGNIIHQGRCYTKISELPRDVELAGDDIVHKQFALAERKKAVEDAQRELEIEQSLVAGGHADEAVESPEAPEAPVDLLNERPRRTRRSLEADD